MYHQIILLALEEFLSLQQQFGSPEEFEMFTLGKEVRINIEAIYN